MLLNPGTLTCGFTAFKYNNLRKELSRNAKNELAYFLLIIHYINIRYKRSRAVRSNVGTN